MCIQVVMMLHDRMYGVRGVQVSSPGSHELRNHVVFSCRATVNLCATSLSGIRQRLVI